MVGQSTYYRSKTILRSKATNVFTCASRNFDNSFYPVKEANGAAFSVLVVVAVAFYFLQVCETGRKTVLCKVYSMLRFTLVHDRLHFCTGRRRSWLVERLTTSYFYSLDFVVYLVTKDFILSLIVRNVLRQNKMYIIFSLWFPCLLKSNQKFSFCDSLFSSAKDNKNLFEVS